MSDSCTLSDWTARVAARETRVAIIGLGYVGLPLALLFCEAGFTVTGFDIDHSKVEKLNAGLSYIHRIPAAEIEVARAAGFTATADFTRLRHCDAVLICVPTPLRVIDGQPHIPDLSFVQQTAESIAPHSFTGQLIVLESTTYPGTTTELVVPTLQRLGPPDLPLHTDSGATPGLNTIICGNLIAFSPEREDPGNRTIPRRSIPKVIGGTSSTATAAAAALYGSIFDRTVQMSSPEAAEMTKLLENIYRGVNIALVNELKQLCLAMKIDIWEVIDAASTKPFGFAPFYPGPGVGGHCIPVDPFYLSWRARQFGQPTRFIELAGEVNEAMPGFIVRTLEQALAEPPNHQPPQPLAQARILLLGVAYKRDVDDLRESPALALFDLLQRACAEVCYNDPFFPEVGVGRHYSLKRLSTPLDRVHEFDCVVLVTDHSAYDIPALVAASRLFVDTRNATRGLTSANIIRC